MTVDRRGRRRHHRTVDRIAGLLESAARATDGLTLSELARQVDAPVTSVHALVNGLTAAGFLVERDRRFRLGAAPHVLNLVAGRTVPPISQAELNHLGKIAGTTILLAVLVGHDIVYVARGGPDAVPRLAHIADGHWARPALRTAAGRLLLALADTADRRDVLDALAVEDPDGVAEFVTQISTIRRRRTARSDGLADPSVTALALPVTQGSQVLGALVLIAPRAPVGSAAHPLDRAARRVLRAVADF